MPQRTPSLASALQHALVATMAVTYLVAAFIQLHRDNLLYGAINGLIAFLLGLILQTGTTTHGRILSNYSHRRKHKRLKSQQQCGWCGETIEAKTTAISHRGAIDGEPFLLHHHPECESAVYDWYTTNATEGTTDLPYPRPGSMQRGSPDPRDTN